MVRVRMRRGESRRSEVQGERGSASGPEGQGDRGTISIRVSMEGQRLSARGLGQAWEDQKPEDQGEVQGERGRATVNVRGQRIRARGLGAASVWQRVRARGLGAVSVHLA